MHLIVHHKKHKIQLNVNHVKLLTEKLQHTCEEYIRSIKEPQEGTGMKIVNSHTSPVAHTKKKPKAYPIEIKPIVVTKWSNQRFYLVTRKDTSKEEWIPTRNVNKEAISAYNKKNVRRNIMETCRTRLQTKTVGGATHYMPKTQTPSASLWKT